MAYWNKLKQENIEKQNRKNNKKLNKRHSLGSVNGNSNPLLYQQENLDSFFQPQTKWDYYRNAAHPRKAKYIMNIQGCFLPTIFDSESVMNGNLSKNDMTKSLDVCYYERENQKFNRNKINPFLTMRNSSPPSAGLPVDRQVLDRELIHGTHVMPQTAGLCLNDILQFDQTKHNNELDARNKKLDEIQIEKYKSISKENTEVASHKSLPVSSASNRPKSALPAISKPDVEGVKFSPQEHKVSFANMKSRKSVPTWKKALVK